MCHVSKHVVMACCLIVLLAPCVSAQVPEALYAKFNEGSGTTTVNDASPGAVPGPFTLPTNATWNASGRFGSALQFTSASGGGLSTGWTPDLPNTQSWTMEFWVNAAPASTNYMMGVNVALTFRLFTLAGGGITLAGSNFSNLTFSSGALDNTWHHVAYVFDSVAKTMTAFVDGVQVAQNVNQTAGAITGAGPFFIGGQGASFTSFGGLIDDFRFWLVARTQAEIQANMNGEIGTTPTPDMAVERNSNPIPDAGADNLTDVSTLGQAFTYEVHNTGTADLNLTGTPAVVVTPGAGAPAVSVIAQPALTTISSPGSTTFQIEVSPSVGPFDFTVSIDNDDPLKNPYTFTVSGNGVITNFPAAASLPAGSAFSAITPGLEFAMSLNPGQALANAVITLEDPESDDINITAVTPVSAPPSGIVAPSTGIVTSPHALTWTGDALASNAPGSYTWLVDFEDVVNGASVRIEVTITINDLPPVHTIAAADGGDGSSGNPYTTVYNQADGQAATVDLAAVSDPNTSQNVTIGGVQLGGGNPAGGTGFAFTLSGGMLTIAPDGAPLAAQDMGTHTFNVEVTDGANPVNIHAEVVVIGATGAITFDTPSPLPAGRVDQPYSQQIAISGATGTATFSITSGALPAGLSMNAQGLITGTPTTPQQSTFTVRVIDSNPDTATATFDLTINPKPIGGGSGSSGSSGGCAGQQDSAGWLLALFAVAAGLILRGRRRRA